MKTPTSVDSFTLGPDPRNSEMNKALLREIISPRGERVRYADEKTQP